MRHPEFKVHLEDDDTFTIRDFPKGSWLGMYSGDTPFKTLELGPGTIHLFYSDDKPIRQLARLLQDAGYLNPETEE